MIYDNVTVKRAVVDGVPQFWVNVYPVLAADGFNVASAAATSQGIFVAETHIHLNHVWQEFSVMCPAWPINYGAETWEGYAHPERRFGDRHWGHDEGAALGFDWALQIKRQPLLGRAASFYWRQCLVEGDVNQEIGGVIGLKHSNSTDWTSLRQAFFYLQDVPWPHQIVSRGTGGIYAIGARAMESITYSQVVKLRSIADAQLRKTSAGLSYQLRTGEAMALVGNMLALWQEKMSLSRDFLLRDEAIALIGVFNAVASEMQAISQYWTDGLDPEFVPHYRPSYSGLDPHSSTCQDIAASAGVIAERFTRNVEKYIDLSLEQIPKHQFLVLWPDVWRITVCYARVLQWCRFTGTPSASVIAV